MRSIATATGTTPYLNRHLALALKVLRKWDGAVWDHQEPSYVELRTPQAVIEKSAYAIANPVAAGLVRSATEWPGVMTRPTEIGSAVWRVERPEQYFTANDDKWPPAVELRLSMPPAAEQLGVSDDQFRALVADEVARLEVAARQEVKKQGWSFLGADPVREALALRAGALVGAGSRPQSDVRGGSRQPRSALRGRGQAPHVSAGVSAAARGVESRRAERAIPRGHVADAAPARCPVEEPTAAAARDAPPA